MKLVPPYLGLLVTALALSACQPTPAGRPAQTAGPVPPVQPSAVPPTSFTSTGMEHDCGTLELKAGSVNVTSVGSANGEFAGCTEAINVVSAHDERSAQGPQTVAGWTCDTSKRNAAEIWCLQNGLVVRTVPVHQW